MSGMGGYRQLVNDSCACVFVPMKGVDVESSYGLHRLFTNHEIRWTQYYLRVFMKRFLPTAWYITKCLVLIFVCQMLVDLSVKQFISLSLDSYLMKHSLMLAFI